MLLLIAVCATLMWVKRASHWGPWYLPVNTRGPIGKEMFINKVLRCIVGCPYFQKFWPLILPQRYVIPMYEKTYFPEYRSFPTSSYFGKSKFKMVLTPFRWEKNCADYRVHGIQIDRLGITVSTQKSVLKNMRRGQRYRTKCIKFFWFGLEGRYLTLFC